MLGDVVLAAGAARLSVALDGGRWTSWRVPVAGAAPRGDGAAELLGRGGDTVFGAGCFPMAPWAGRVRGGRLRWPAGPGGRTHQLPLLEPPHALHGTVLDAPWQVLEAGDDAVLLGCRLDSRWPWRGRVLQRLALAEDALTAQLVVEAEQEEEMPAWSGFHPWLRRRLDLGGGTSGARESAEVVLDVPADGVLRREDGVATGELVPVPPQPWDDCFDGVRWPVRATWPGALELAVEATSSAGPPVAVVFTGRPAAVCVEPQTAPPDAAALGRAAVVRPEEPLVLTTSWRWSAPAGTPATG